MALADQEYPLWRDGRGPVLLQVHYGLTGTGLKAIDFVDVGEKIGHALFSRSQVFMFTPEEVENTTKSSPDFVNVDGVAVSFLGRSPWLISFNQHHLAKCEHFRVMFYDYYLDVICEKVFFHEGRFEAD